MEACGCWTTRPERRTSNQVASTEVFKASFSKGGQRSERNRQTGVAQACQSNGHALLNSPSVGPHPMRQRATAGGERPRWRVVSQSLGVHPDHGIHALLAQPLQDQKRYVLDAAFLIDLQPTASVPSHHSDSIEAPEVVQGPQRASSEKLVSAVPCCEVDSAQRTRLIEIICSLSERIAEAKLNGWLGEEGLRVSLEAARNKLAAMDRIRNQSITRIADLGIP
ncbi:hypothetical protein ACL07V_34700 [Streptomyces sp. MB22_4]|uniref:hypothetical protein n=1 Tax=Streptomyces sp. MB22_4 TaxID=3383120 RepID=UPI00399F2591